MVASTTCAGPYAVPMIPWKTAGWTFGVLGCLSACQTNTSVETSIEATLDRLQQEDRTNAILAIVPDALDQARGLKRKDPGKENRSLIIHSRYFPFQPIVHFTDKIFVVENHLKDGGFQSWLNECNTENKITSKSLSSKVIEKVGSQSFLMKFLK